MTAAAAALLSLAPLPATSHQSAGPVLKTPQAETAAQPAVRLAHRRKRGAERETRKPRPRAESLSQKHEETAGAPVQLIVSLKNQRVAVFKGRQQLASAPISSGRPGYRTPTGIFSILQKKRRHYSNLYGRAPMPHMQRLTWSGVALHGGPLPGYPASHGCIRLPRSFARELFGVTEKGAHVIVAHDMPEPVEIEHANLFRPTSRRAILAGGERMQPQPGPPAPEDRRAGDGRPRVWLAALTAAPHAEEFPEDDEERRRRAAEAASLQLADTEATLERLIAFERRSPAPLRILISWRARGRELKQAQRMMAELGYEPGPVDGYLGRRTVGAIKRFRDDYALEPDWRVDEAMMAMLYRATGREPPAPGHLYVRQNFTDLFDVPVHISGEEGTLGTHIYTLTRFNPQQEHARWSAITVRERPPKADKRKSAKDRREGAGSDNAKSDETDAEPFASATEALARIDIPEHVRRRISDLLTPGSSLIISDNGISRETGKGTDFVVLTR